MKIVTPFRADSLIVGKKQKSWAQEEFNRGNSYAGGWCTYLNIEVSAKHLLYTKHSAKSWNNHNKLKPVLDLKQSTI